MSATITYVNNWGFDDPTVYPWVSTGNNIVSETWYNTIVASWNGVGDWSWFGVDSTTEGVNSYIYAGPIDGAQIALNIINTKGKKGHNIAPVPLNLNVKSSKGHFFIQKKLFFSLVNSLSQSNIILTVFGGKDYTTGLPFKLPMFRVGLSTKRNLSINMITSIVVGYLYKNSQKLKGSILKHLQNMFSISYNYNMYTKDSYYDAYVLGDENAIKCVKLSSHIYFIASICRKLSTGFKVDGFFYLNVYNAIYSTLNENFTVCLPEFNKYLACYDECFISDEFTDVINSWSKFLQCENDIVKIIILKHSCDVLSKEVFIENFKTIFNEIDYDTSKARLEECFKYKKSCVR